MKAGTKLKHLCVKESQEFTIELAKDLFISIAADENSEAVGVWIPHTSIKDAKTLELLQTGAELLKRPLKELRLKVVGEKSVVEEFKAYFNARPWKSLDLRARENLETLLFYPANGRIRISKSANQKIRVLIVDDSSTIRQLLEKILHTDPEIEFLCSLRAPWPYFPACPRIRHDLIKLDFQMPEMDGVALLHKYIPTHPIPTVMISSISFEEGPLVLSALEAGAVDYIRKPSFEELKKIAPMLIEKVKGAATAKVLSTRNRSTVRGVSGKKSSVKSGSGKISDTLVAIGSSTGGTEALRQVLTSLPAEIPPILIVQHIPAVFSKAFADRMNGLCPFEVKEAENKDEVLPNRVLIAPGGTQMKLVSDGSKYRVRIDPLADPVNRHKPSVDVLFNSVAELAKHRAIGVILTGMGADGAKGLLKMRQMGARTIGQDEETSVVYGMPFAAFKLGAVEEQRPLTQIADGILDLLALIQTKLTRKGA